MTRLPLAICLALGWFLLVNILVSLAVAAAVALRRGTGAMLDHRITGPVALALRFLPVCSASLFVTCVFLPGFLWYERAGGPEPVGWLVIATATFAVTLGVASGVRGAIAQRRAGSLEDAWAATAAPIAMGEILPDTVSACAIDDPFPVVALVGIRRPRLYIARQVLDALTPGELCGAVAHEIAHRRAGDNIVRLAMAWSPDLIGWLPVSRRLERDWAAAAECAADRRAAAGSRRRSVDLASALVKVSRLAMDAPPRLPLFSTLHERGIADRVSRLVTPESRDRRRAGARGVVVATIAFLATVAWLPATWATVHAVSETWVHLLP